MSTKLTYTGAEVQELLDKIGKGDFDNAKTLEGHPASYFAIASEFTSLAESFATEQGRISALYSYFNNGSANDALRLGGRLPSYYATATQYKILQQALSDFKSLFDSMFEKDSNGNIHAKLSLWSSGGITAGSAGSGGSGGGGISYNRLDSWADYSVDKAGYVLSAALGKDLDNRVSALANAGYITASYLAPYALRSEIPSLVGYATQGWVGENYLSKSGGKLVYSGAQGIEAERTDGAPSHIMFIGLVNGTSRQLGGFGMNGYNDPVYVNPNGIRHKVLTAENYSNYALPITGGRISGDLKLTSCEVGNDNAHSGKLIFAGANNDYGNNDYKMGPYIQAINIGGWGKKKISFFQRDWSVEGFDADPEEVFSIMPNGNILIGSTEDSGEKLQVNGNVKANSFIGNLTGNADSATKLATPRTIWGQSFDGTGDISGSLNFRNGSSITCANGIVLEMYAGVDTYLRGSSNIYLSAPDVYTQRNIYTYKVLDSGNYSDYALPKTGGTLTGTTSIPLYIKSSHATEAAVGFGANNAKGYGYIVYKGGDSWAVTKEQWGAEYSILHSGNYSNLLAGGTINGSLTATSFTGVINSVAPKALFRAMSYTAGQYSRSASEEDGKIFIGSSVNNKVISSPNYDGTNTAQNIQSLRLAYNSSFFTEIATTPNSNHLWKRNVEAGGANPWERFVTEKAGVTWNISITGNADSATKLQTPRTIWGQSFDGTGDITGALTSQALRSAGISIGCDASGVASDNYTREINTFVNKLYLQYRGGDLDVCGGGGTTYIGGALEGKTANFTSLTAPAVTTNTLKVGNVTLVEENGALKVIGGFIATGGVTSGEKAS